MNKIDVTNCKDGLYTHLQRVVYNPGILLHIAIIVFIQLTYLFSDAQNIPCREISSKSSSEIGEIYCIHQDTVGLIWLGTENGLFSFDGYHFRKDTTFKQSDEAIISLVILANNQKIVGNSSGFIFIQKGNQFFSLDPLNDATLRGQFRWTATYDSQRDWVQVIRKNTLFRFSETQQATIHIPTTEKGWDIIASWQKGDTLQCTDGRQIISCVDDHFKFGQTIPHHALIRPRINNFQESSINHPIVYKRNNQVFQLQLNPLKLSELINDDYIRISSDEGKLFSTKNYMWVAGQLFSILDSGLLIGRLNVSVNNMFEDAHGNLWIAVNNGNLLFISHQSLLAISTSKIKIIDLPPYHLMQSNEQGLLLLGSDQLTRYNISENRLDTLAIVPNSNQYERIDQLANSIYLRSQSANKIISAHDLNSNVKVHSELKFHAIKDVVQTPHGEIIATHRSIYFLRKQNDSLDLIHNGRCFKLTFNSSLNAMLAVTVGGLLYHPFTGNSSRLITTLNNEKIHDISAFNETFWVSHGDHNFSVISLSSDSISLSSSKIRLRLPQFTVAKNSLVAWDKRGVIVYTNAQEITQREFFSLMNLTNGAPIKWIEHTSKNIHVFTESSLISIPLHHLKKLRQKTVTDYLLLNGVSPQPLKMEFSPKNRDLFLSIFDPTYQFSDFSYRLFRSHSENALIPLNDNVIERFNLSPGNYQLHIHNNSPLAIPVPVYSSTIRFEPKLNETTWFKVLLISCIFAFILVFLLKSITNRLKQEKLTKQIQLETFKSLTLQMNPHFLYNTLNSVQYLIRSNQNRHANYYIVQLSRFLTQILKSSKNEFIPLSAEIQIIERQMELEKLRFKEKLIWELHVDQNVDTDSVKIPPFVIQPLVENALKHGKTNQNESLIVSCRILNQTNKTLIIVTDNGGGINEESTEQGTGIRNINDRLKLVNQLYGTRILMSRRNVKHESNYGLEVTIEL